MEETDAQVLPSKQNNVEQSNVQSTVDGPDTLHGDLAPRLVEAVSQPVSDIVQNHHQNTMDDLVKVKDQKRRNVTLSTVPLMEFTQDGLNGQLAVLLVEVELRPETENAHHPDMEEKAVWCSEMQLILENATPMNAH